ncbi:elongation factor 1-gamma-like isoform X2 [Clytia hemisphaerica]|uniref:elongation factor 1-gamma-like isoform X2 n=1 Tax=Clytia hemisphaerica TaxID=252671 RepID=UPI0034D7AFE6
MASGTLYTYSGSFRANKILVAAAYSGANVTVADFEYGKTNTSADFLKKFPLGRVPAYESNGLCLSESDAIAQYVSNDALLGGKDSANQASVREYISFAENEIVPSACAWVYPTLGLRQYNKQETDNAMAHLKKCLTKLNNDLLTRTFLVGERVTLADITLCTSLVMLYVQVMDSKFREAFGNLNRWFTTCVNQPNFKKVLGDIKLCEKMATFDNKRYQELHPKGGKGKKTEEKAKKTKEAKPKPQEQPIEEAAKEPKKVDHFKDWKKSDKFNMDAWKTEYANEELSDSLKWFDEHWDPEAFAVYHAQYRFEKDSDYETYNLEFLATNLVRGFYQRIEGLRKHCHIVFLFHEKKSPKGAKYYDMTGCIIQKAQPLCFSYDEIWNEFSQSFTWTKLGGADVNKYVKAYFSGEHPDGTDVVNFDEFR